MNSNNEFLLEMRNMVKTFPGVKAVDDVTLRVRPGTVHALVGENGAGKSTMMKILAGEYKPDSGEIWFNGEKIEIKTTQDAFDVGVSTVYQELNLVPDMTIAENMFLGREPRKNGVFIDSAYILKETSRYLNDIGLEGYSPKTKLKKLSVSQQQMVEIAKGIHRGSSLIVLDEPTSAITDAEVATLFKLINELKAKGITFIYISHKMNEIFEITDEITVMRDGTYVDTKKTSDMTEKSLVTLMVGRELTHLFPKTDVPIGDVVLEARNLCREGAFYDVSFKIRQGEILGISGLMGAGRTEVARAIFGLDMLDSGEMELNGLPYEVKKPIDAIRNGIAYVSEDRKEEGLCLGRSILENISLASLEMFTDKGFLDLKYEREKGAEISQQLKTKTHSLDVSAETLSGGNQQKVVLSKWLIRPLKILILDEPTRGIDVGAKSEIHKLMCKFAANGLAVIMISSELPEILGMSDRVIVMHEGKFKGELSREDATQERIMTLATGGKNE